MWAVNPLDPSNTVFSSHPPTMGYVQTREHEAENCYVYISREELRETYAELKRLARIDRNFGDERSAKNLEGLAHRFGELLDLAHHNRVHFQICPMNTSKY